jgi:hypothetical protein
MEPHIIRWPFQGWNLTLAISGMEPHILSAGHFRDGTSHYLLAISGMEPHIIRWQGWNLTLSAGHFRDGTSHYLLLMPDTT